MKYMVFKSLLMLVSSCLLESAYVQECKVKETKEDLPHQKVAFIISHTHIPAVNERTGEKKTFIAASIGANYEYWFNAK